MLQYGGRPFKISNGHRWLVILSNPKLIDELRRAPDDELSFLDSVNEVCTVYSQMCMRVPNRPYLAVVASAEVYNAGCFTEYVPRTDHSHRIDAQS
jgi:hypothetical protein